MKSAFATRFQLPPFRALSNFFGQESHPPPSKSEGARATVKLSEGDWGAGFLPCVLSVMLGEEPSLFVAMRMSLSNKLSSTRAPTSSKRVTERKRKITACKFRYKTICSAMRTRFSSHYLHEKINPGGTARKQMAEHLHKSEKKNETKHNVHVIVWLTHRQHLFAV